jgi:nucleotide-binding universal stress UspA family protein
VEVRRVLVGFDGSDSAQDALTWAVETARLHGATVTALCVATPALDAWIARRTGAPEGRAGTEDLGWALQRSVEAPVRVSVRHGRPAEELVAAAEDADLLVVGARGLGGARALLLGSVSRACLHHAPAAVAVVRRLSARPPASERAVTRAATVVVGVDGSACSRRALRAAADEARLRGADLVALHAVGWDYPGIALLAPSEKELLTWGRELVRSELRRADVSARAVVRSGHAAQLLARASRRADLLVLGSAGHGALSAITTGSTTDHCVQHASCPLLVIR